MWSSGVSSVISVMYLLIPFTIITQVQVPSPNKDSVIHLDSVTALMMTDCHLPALAPISSLRSFLKFLYFRYVFVKPRIHPFTLENALSQSKVYSRHEPRDLSSSTSSRVVKHCPLATVFVIPALEHSLISWRWSGRLSNCCSQSYSRFPCTLSVVRGVLFVVDNSVGITMVSGLFWVTSSRVRSELREIQQANSSHMSATAPKILSWLTEMIVRRNEFSGVVVATEV